MAVKGHLGIYIPFCSTGSIVIMCSSVSHRSPKSSLRAGSTKANSSLYLLQVLRGVPGYSNDLVKFCQINEYTWERQAEGQAMTHRKSEQRQKETRENKNRKGERDQLMGWGDNHRRQDNDGRGRRNRAREARRWEVWEPHNSPHCAAHLGSVYYHPSLNFKSLPPLFIVVHSSQN